MTYILLNSHMFPLLNESKKMGRSRPCPEDATVMSCSEP